ncbi:MAG: OmpA family protein [Capnocytophaga sp.]|nr:OmpA family protein [Capnocytophaga sp.]
MRRSLYLLGILLTLIIGAILQYIYCCNCGTVYGETTETVVETTTVIPETPQAFSLNGFDFSTDSFRVSHPDNFLFSGGSYEFQKPLSDGFIKAVSDAKANFHDNPNKSLDIIGHYALSETNDSAFPTLGLARANAVKNYLVGAGYPAKQITISDKIIEGISDSDGLWHELTTYSVNDISVENNDAALVNMKAFADDLKKNPIRLYFETGASRIALTAEERSKIQQLSDYLTHVDDARILVIGNTDNVGARELNLKLGEERAEYIKSYLVRNNFAADAIETVSNGPNKPIADNKTEEGRAENRRVEITLK